jgi:cell division protein FtsA
LIDSFNRSGKRLEHSYVRPDALLNVLTTESDAEKGCAILDLGAQTTTLTVYKGNQYLYNKVIPLGGYDITRDIEQLGISLAYAESLKCKYGFASSELVQKDHRFRIPAVEPTRGEIVVTSSELAQIISNRLSQITTPLFEQLNSESGRFGVLYITGGGSMLQGILPYLQARTTIPVMYGSHAAWLTPDTPDDMCMPTYSALVGTLLLGASYRKAHPVAAPNNNRKKIIDFLTEKTLEMFLEQPES